MLVRGPFLHDNIHIRIKQLIQLLVRGLCPHDNIHQIYYNLNTCTVTYLLKAFEFHLPIDWICLQLFSNCCCSSCTYVETVTCTCDCLSFSQVSYRDKSEKNWCEMDDPSIYENRTVYLFVCFLTCQYIVFPHSLYRAKINMFVVLYQ